jgi:hypothetical protein
MPITPSSYRTNYPITAHQLNQDMYTYDGSYFGANGVMFHSNRPMLIESYQIPSIIAAKKGGSFTTLGGTDGDAISILDTAAYFGTGSDGPGDYARFQSSGAVAPSSAGVYGEIGGWQLIFTSVPIGQFSGTSNTYGIVWNLAAEGGGIGSPLQDIGCMQPGSTVYDNCGFAVDLIERNFNVPGEVYAPAVFAVDPNNTNNEVVANTLSTTGQTPRYSEIWMAVLNGNGTTVPSIPVPIASIGTATTLTSATLNTSIAQTFNLLNNPPMLNAQVQSTVGITANAITKVPFTATPQIDNYSHYNKSTSQYTVPLSGIYLCHANIIYNTAFNVGQAVVGFSVASSIFWGGAYNATPPGAQNTGASVTKILDLNAGDLLEIVTETSANTAFGTANVSHFIMTWLAPINTSKQTWVPPDVTGFQFSAATPPGTAATGLVTVLNTKLANDINFLLNKPYLTVHQTTASVAQSVNAWHPMTMQSTLGLVHASLGDNYSGWSSANNNYVAPVSGWYLCVAELNAATITTANSYNSLIAGFSVPTSGGVASPTSGSAPPDWYQQLNVSNAWTYPTGATAMNVYYLLAGETIAPVAQYKSGTATTWTSDITHGFLSHFNCIWMSN